MPFFLGCTKADWDDCSRNLCLHIFALTLWDSAAQGRAEAELREAGVGQAVGQAWGRQGHGALPSALSQSSRAAPSDKAFEQ